MLTDVLADVFTDLQDSRNVAKVFVVDDKTLISPQKVNLSQIPDYTAFFEEVTKIIQFVGERKKRRDLRSTRICLDLGAVEQLSMGSGGCFITQSNHYTLYISNQHKLGIIPSPTVAQVLSLSGIQNRFTVYQDRNKFLENKN